MLPEITLREPTREDVARIVRWLEDEEISSRWCGHYARGDPAHRGYDPYQMLGAFEWEWDYVFRDHPYLLVLSIYSEQNEHIGECQGLISDHGGVELSLLLGRKDLWHRGYGTSTVTVLLDYIFNFYGMDWVWVNIPENNIPGLRLFKKLGFVQRGTSEGCNWMYRHAKFPEEEPFETIASEPRTAL